MAVTTYGGEIEMLAVNPDGSLAPIDLVSISGFNKDKNHLPINEVGGLTYDSCTHLLEANIFPTISLGELLERVRMVVSSTINVTKNTGVHLLNSSTYPLGTYQQAYANNVRKIIYALFRGPATDNERKFIEALGKNYQHRNWKHEYSSMFAGIQPWNSVNLEDIESILQSLFIGSPLGKYVTANGGYIQGKETTYTDNRWRMYDPSEGMLSTSIYPEDLELLKKFPGKNFMLSSYFHHVFSNFRMSFIGNKDGLLAFKVPLKIKELLHAKNVSYINAGDNSEGIMSHPAEELSFSDIYGSCIFFPDFKLRIVSGEDSSEIKGKSLLDLFEAIELGNEVFIKDIFQKHKTRFCIEGRNYSTNLPQGEDFSSTYFPFIFQTLLIKNHKKIVEVAQKTGINFGELNTHIYKNGLDTGDTEKLTQLAEAIFSNTKDFSEAEQVLIHAAEVRFFNIIKNKTPKSTQDKQIHGSDVNAFIQRNLV